MSTKCQSHGIYSVLWPCTVACIVPCTVRALYVYCAKHSLCNSASGGVEALSLFVGSGYEDEHIFGLGLWHVQKGICSSLCLHSHKQKNIVLLCLLGSSFEDESVFGLRLWQVQKVICSSLCLYIVYGCTNTSLNKFPFARAKTPIQTYFHLQSCYPQTKKQHCSICSARGQKYKIRVVCLAWCTNVECACTPPEAELHRSADENIRGHKHCILHSARIVHAQCTLQCTSQCTVTKRCKYHVFSQK